MRRAKIVSTLGPASRSSDVVQGLIAAGANVLRLNFSHGKYEDHALSVKTVREASDILNQPVAILQDLQGPKIRVGNIETPIRLEVGASLVITTRNVPGRAGLVSTTYSRLPNDVGPGDRLLMDDGQIELRVEAVQDEDVKCTVVVGGILSAHKGINLPGVKVSAPSVTDKDREDLAFGI